MDVNKINIKGRLYGLRLDFSQTIKRSLFKLHIVPPPFRISLDITDACNFQCPTCDKWKTPLSSHDLSLAEWETVFSKIKNLSLFKEIAISGGEPFVHPHILDLLKIAKESDLKIVVVSNGGVLTEEILTTLNVIGVDQLMLSLNSLVPAIHDKSRGKPGNHKHILNLIESWKKSDKTMQMSLSTMIMEPNVHELSSMALFVKQNQLSGIMFQAVLPKETHYAFSSGIEKIPMNIDWHQNNPYWVKSITILKKQIMQLITLQNQGFPIHNPPSQLKQFIGYFENFKQQHKTPCIGTQNRLFIDPYGDLRLCYGYAVIGNILKDNPYKLWRSAAAKQIRKESRTCNKPCRLQNCNI